MTLFRHELRRCRLSFLIWTGAISLLLATCLFLFPEMKQEMESVGDLFSSMGSFTAAFGMDKLNFGTLIGYYAIECGNILGLGGAIFAALSAVGMLCKEEKDGTAELLLSHPVSRTWILTQKLLALLAQLAALNLIVWLCAVGSMLAVGERIPWQELNRMHLAYFLLQLELSSVCFGISALLRRSGAGIGLGVAALCYVLNLIANITERAKPLKTITPFGYCDGAELVTEGLNGGRIALGMAFGLVGIAFAYWYYPKKDIR